jgi:hypothetical protein
MKFIKPALLVTATAIVVSLLIGASTASAHKWITVCLEQRLLQCASRVKHPLLGRKLIIQLGTSAFKAGFEIKCIEGQGESNEIESQQEGGAGEVKEFKSELVKLTFGGCSGGCAEFAVKVPQSLSLSDSNLLTPNWRILLTNLVISFTKCTFGVTCEFEGNLNVALQMNESESFFEPENTKFKFIKGSKLLCGETGTWTTGKFTLKWRLDNLFGTEHVFWPSLVDELVVVN